MRRHVLSFASATVLLASGLSAQTTVYSTFGPGDSYDGSAEYNAALTADVFFGLNMQMAAGFLYGGPSGNLLSGIRFAGNPSFGFPGPLDLAFLVGPTIGGASVLESWVLPSSSTGPIYSLTSILEPVLTSGSTYWVRLKPGAASQTYWSWFLNDQGFTGYQRSLDGGATWFSNAGPTPAFDVTSISGSVVPEPTTMTLLATGLVGLATLSRRRRKKT